MFRRFVMPVMAALLLTGVVGCGDEPGQPAPVTDRDPGEDVEDVEDVVAVPALEPRVEIESTHGGFANTDPIDWSVIGSQQVHVSKYSNYSSCTIFIANFETDESLRTVTVEPGQGVVYFSLRLPPESDPIVGDYDLTHDGEFGGTASIRITGGTTVQTSRSSMTVGELEIIEVTDTQVSGTFHVADNWTNLSGAFVATIR